MKYNLSTQARLQAQKDICEELAKEGKTYIDVSLKALQAFQESLQGLDFLCACSYSWYPLDKGRNGKYNKVKKQYRWAI